MSAQPHIHPVFHRLLPRSEKEQFLHQRSRVIWFTGLIGSGKSTLAERLEKELWSRKFFPVVLDGDNIRSGINANLGFGSEDRLENIRRIAEISKLFSHAGVISINCFVSPTREIRSLARNIIGAEDFLEIYVNCPLPICEQRDVKGLYAKARRGEIPDFTGITAPFEAPDQPFLELQTDRDDLDQSMEKLLEKLLPQISL